MGSGPVNELQVLLSGPLLLAISCKPANQMPVFAGRDVGTLSTAYAH